MKTTQQKVGLGFGILVVALLLVGVCSLTACKGGTSTQPVSTVDEGKATLAGIDANNDGVRDDVAAYIAQSHPNSAKERAALTQYAKVMQSALLDANDKALSIQHMEETSKALECMSYTAGSVEGAIAMKGDLRSLVLNTDDRNRAYFAFNDKLGGGVFSATPDSQISATCTVNPATLPN